MRASRQGKTLIDKTIQEHNQNNKDNKYTRTNDSLAIADGAIQYINTVKVQNGWTDKSKLCLEQIKELKIINNGVPLSKEVCQAKKIQLPIPLKDIKEYVKSQYWKVSGFSDRSWKDFVGGKVPIKDYVFIAYCAILNLSIGKVANFGTCGDSSKRLPRLLYEFNHHSPKRLCNQATAQNNNLMILKIATRPDNKLKLYWLLNRLRIALKPDDEIELKKFDMNSPTYNKIDDLFKEIIEKFGLPQRTQSLSKQVYKQIKAKDKSTFLVFFNVDKKPKSDLDLLLNKFWKPLTEEWTKEQNEHHLIMCWIDYQEDIDWRKMYFFHDNMSQELDNSSLFNCNIPDRFTLEDIKHWLNLDSVSRFTAQYNTFNLSNISDIIWQESEQGNAELLLKSIYQQCDLTWEEHQDLWLKL
ncbi:hypothetical protein [Aphanothece sacrum]|uniref:ComF family protein n=1 Tax=Aphanothece sacrum FPU1 TaxID=1920663 RepID=A0A401IIL5_APHSA|nr:hypothetical protein [Aphanothece sacrum]GBF81152.1 ComF family protein [Aphanothece sacrum FPU1]GBF83500.1 comF family protein [Aphanothece sacrum FPU3]